MDNIFVAGLIGYDKIQDIIFSSIENKTMHHALLFSSLEGSGKQKLCLKIAEKLLESHANNFNIDIKQHPDIKIITPDLNESKKGEITIKQIRALNSFLQLKSGFSDCKIIILDAIDNLNQNAANSLLKILEEPPENSYFLCLSHNPCKLLDTIKSRMIHLKLPALSKDQTREIIQNQELNVAKSELDAALDLFPRQPGKVAELLANGSLKLLPEIKEILSKHSVVACENFIKKCDLKDNQSFTLLNELISHEIYLFSKKSETSKEALSSFWLNIPLKYSECIKLNLDRSNFLRNLISNFHTLYAK